ncbi:twin-arginine translocation signal domain-containing protein [Eggerthella sinensis]|uniref:twin-arginine translocation signal domain-containing protein n=1 Tax=Eggerthella sinensis TaxID=242230 RepID=UPI0022E3C4D6|nr:twin-arginine translocation signal domain-containing protein [Eggerthella sinensis]
MFDSTVSRRTFLKGSAAAASLGAVGTLSLSAWRADEAHAAGGDARSRRRCATAARASAA